MASRSDIEAGRAHVLLYMRDQLSKGLASIAGKLKSLGAGMKDFGSILIKVGAGVAAGLGAAVTHFISAGSALNDMSVRTGIAASELAELKFAAEQTGSTLEDVETAVRKLQVTLAQAKAGSASARKEFRDLGLSWSELAGKPPGKQFEAVAEAIAKIPDPAARSAAAVGLFGKSGTKLLPMIADMRALRVEAQRLGLAPSDSSVAAADALGDLVDKIKSSLAAATFELGGALVDPLKEAGGVVLAITSNIGKWVRENGDVIRQVGKIAIGLVAAGAVIYSIGGAAAGLATIISGVIAALGVVGPTLALIFSPAGLTIAAIVAGITLLVRNLPALKEGLSSAFAPLLKFGKEFGKDFGDTWKSIVDAVSSGDLKLAFDVALAGLTLSWVRFTSGLTKEWVRFTTLFVQTLEEAWNRVAKGLIEIQRGFEWGTLPIGPSAAKDAMNKKYDDQLRTLDEDKARRDKQRFSSADQGIAAAEKSLLDAQDELNRLRSKARRQNEYGSPSGKPVVPATASDGRTFATFSAAGLGANLKGGASNPVVVKLADLIKITDKAHKEELKHLRGIDKLEAAKFAF